MPKLKTHSGAKKRFNLTKTGKIKRAHAFKSHILTKKTTKRTRRLRTTTYADVNLRRRHQPGSHQKDDSLQVRDRRIYKWHVLKAQ